MSKKWQYLVVETKTSLMGGFKLDDMRATLDTHGRQGWELVNVIHATPGFSAPTLIFKKEQ